LAWELLTNQQRKPLNINDLGGGPHKVLIVNDLQKFSPYHKLRPLSSNKVKNLLKKSLALFSFCDNLWA